MPNPSIQFVGEDAYGPVFDVTDLSGKTERVFLLANTSDERSWTLKNGVKLMK